MLKELLMTQNATSGYLDRFKGLFKHSKYVVNAFICTVKRFYILLTTVTSRDQHHLVVNHLFDASEDI